MRQRGRIVEWQDDRGFGFISPLTGGDRVFAHITSFRHRNGRRPAAGELVACKTARDARGRLQGTSIRFTALDERCDAILRHHSSPGRPGEAAS